MVQVYYSRFTPGLQNAEGLRLEHGEEIAYRLLDGSLVTGTVQSELSRHCSGCLGWEVLFADTKALGFADAKRIVGWRGKIP